MVLPENFIPMYPNWSIDLQNPDQWAVYLKELTRNAVDMPGPEIERLGKVAERAGAHVCLGGERARGSVVVKVLAGETIPGDKRYTIGTHFWGAR